MHLAVQQIHQRSVHPGPLVLRTAPIKFPPPAPDRDRTVSRRSEPSSRTALMGEQPNPWNLLQLQDAMEPTLGYHPYSTGFLTCSRDPAGGQCLTGSLTGAVASERVSEALKGSLRTVGNRSKSAKAEGSLTATPTGGADTKVGLSDPVV